MKKEIRNGAILGYINMVTNIAITLIFIPIMLKLMGQSEYGLYTFITSIVGYLSILDMGFGNAMIRFVSKSQAKNDNNEDKINGMFLLLYTIIGIFSLIVGLIIYNKFGQFFSASLSVFELQKAKKLFIILLINVAISFPLSVFDSYIISNEKYTFTRLSSLLKTILKPLIMLPLLLMGYKSIAMVIVVASVNIFLHALSLFFAFIKLKMKINFNNLMYEKGLFKDIIAYSFFIFLNIIVDNIYSNTDQVILGIVSGTLAVSVYSVAMQISQMYTQCSTIISGLFLPKITKMLEDKDSNIKISNLFIKVSRIQLYLMFLILSGFIIFGKYFISFWVGNNYKDAYYIVLLLICPAIIPLTQNIGISIIQAKNMHQFRSVVYIIIALLNIIISIPLTKLYQGVGAAIGTAIANLLGQIITMNIYYYKKVNLDIPRYWKFFIRLLVQIVIISIIAIIIINKINMNMVTLIFGIIIYSMIYFIVIFQNMNYDEKEYISSFFNAIKKKVHINY